MAVGPQYTSCVQPEDYEDLDVTPQVITLIVAALAGGPVGILAAGAAVMSALERVLDYMLNGKLVCLGGQECCIGVVVGFETTADKTFPDDIDNDFSINILLSPDTAATYIVMPFPTSAETKGQDPADWIKHKHLARAAAGAQGRLIAEQPNMPEPREPVDGYGHYSGYFHTPPSNEWNLQPVLHLECEGSRINDVRKTLEDIGSLGTGGGLCKIPILGPIACAIVSFVLSPIVAAALTYAWFAADEGAMADAMDPGAPPLKKGDLIVSTGRWVYDAGHGGYNELHAVRRIQIINNEKDWTAYQPSAPWGTDFAGFRDRWCSLIADVPPREAPDAPPVPRTAKQEETAARQERPEHRWVLHPAVDGCLPSVPDEGPVEPEEQIIK